MRRKRRMGMGKRKERARRERDGWVGPVVLGLRRERWEDVLG